MATLGLTIKSDFDQATDDLKNFKAASESTTKSVKKFQESFKTEQIDKFTDKQKLNNAAITATRGKLAANQAELRNTQREIERLIKKGLDPQSDSVQKLTKQYDKLENEIDQSTKASKENAKANELVANAGNAAAVGLLAMAAGAIAATGALVKNTFTVAAAGDEYAKTGRRIGLSAEALQELSFAADRQGVSGDELIKGLEKLNKNVGDLQAGYGSLSVNLKATNPELLKSLEAAKSNEEAFALVTDELAGMDNELAKASLAQAVFGRAGLKLLTVTEAGTEGLGKLREEARKYGIISNESAKNAEAFIDAQTNLTAAFTGLKNELGTRLFPTIQKIMESLTGFILEGDNLNKIITSLTYILPSLTGAMITFIAVTKGGAAFKAIATAFKAINLAMASNPIGFIAVAITAVLIPAIIFLIKNWDEVVVILKNTTLNVGMWFQWLGSTIKTAFITAFNSVKIAVLELGQFIFNNLIEKMQTFIGVAAKLPFVGEKFAEINEIVGGFGAVVNDKIEAVQAGAQASIEAANLEKEALILANEKKKELIDKETQARVSAIKKQKKASDKARKENDAAVAASAKNNAEVIKQWDDYTLSNQLSMVKDMISNVSSLASSVSTIMENAGRETRNVAIAQKAIAIVQAGINTALGITQALASLPPPAAYVAAGITATMGLAQQIAIASKPIPSAQTGTPPGGITIPQSSSGSQDNVAVMAAPGETVNVSPRGASGSGVGNLTVNAILDKRILWTVTQEGIDSGEINITNENVEQGVFV